MNEHREIGWAWGGILLLCLFLVQCDMNLKLERLAVAAEKIAEAPK